MTTKDAILKAIKQKTLSPKELAIKIEKPLPSIYTTLGRMVDEKLVVKLEDGKYSIYQEVKPIAAPFGGEREAAEVDAQVEASADEQVENRKPIYEQLNARLAKAVGHSTNLYAQFVRDKDVIINYLEKRIWLLSKESARLHDLLIDHGINPHEDDEDDEGDVDSGE